ncbi:MAG: hypothetical protein RLZZ385_2049 [Pseudomonadota bacterium]|jgi:Bax protein
MRKLVTWLSSAENWLGLGAAGLLSGMILAVQKPAEAPVIPAVLLADQVTGVDYPVLEPIAVFPDFSTVPDVDVKKQWFLDFVEVYVDAENRRVAELRHRLLELADIASNNFRLSRTEHRQLLAMASSYKVDTVDKSDKQIVLELLKRVDTIPTSLALAQAANESAWGTSRFALEGNNLFGQWCYDEGCGLVPTRRAGSATHEVRSFKSIEHAVQAYFMNLNTHAEYQNFREMRFQMRNQKGSLDPLVLAYGLVGYAERGVHYVDEVQTIIQQNDLRNRDKI